jgi:heat shock protein HslJ
MMRVLATTLLLGALAGCAAQSTAPPTAPSGAVQPALLGTTWAAVEIDGKPVEATEPQRPNIVLSASDGRVTGTTGCNRVAGSFTQQGAALRFGMLASTRMACVPDRGPVENAFLAALDATTAQAVTGGTLELRDAAGAVRMRLQAR